jgi:hypothetical protein
MKYTIAENVDIDIRIDGKNETISLTAGDHELHPAIAEVLVEQGLAKPAGTKASKTTPAPESTED